MKKINTAQPINTLAGVQYKDASGNPVTLGMVIAESMAAETTGGKMKIYALATAAYSGKTMEVDDADLALIKRVLETTNVFNSAIINGQALLMLEEVK